MISTYPLVSNGWIYYISKVTGTYKLKRIESQNETRDDNWSKNVGLSTFVSDNYIFYFEQCDENKKDSIVSKNIDSDESVVLVDGSLTNICVNQGNIYYISNLGDKGIFRTNIDGSEKIQLINYSEMKSFCIVDDFIYFFNGADNNRLYRIQLDGTGKELIDGEITSPEESSNDE